MRRLKILFFWLFVNKNNVGFIEMLKFLTKPKIHRIAKNYIDKIIETDDYQVSFKDTDKVLYWPKSFPLNRLDQVICETFDTSDWHYYQKQHTIIAPGEILLDIGTAEGLLSLLEIDKCSHIYMVEPGEKFYKSLQKTFIPYKDKVTIFNVAVGNEDTEIMFSDDSLTGKIVEGNEANAQKIDLRKIDTLLSNNEKITYLKADIEGFEEEMLKGAELTIKRNKPKIAITTYHDQNDPKEIIRIIKGFVPEYNYYVKGIYEETPKPVLIHFWI
ncbi:FkbM family methyltransferase [Flavobacterium salilacus subsp. salilacus]|uniref:FkbM family methyltransferase n=1 Tax=Flavobacterium TaxID=237 RepID=UPI0010753B1D|nr:MULTISPECIES: FkbM family methyltransferase [Flavobacterium]KAF2518983.1 FkbM family methyltransferase [Flavobacterium salilacus subsp. salilacus]MBE1614854.1 FkbM family methyltransferase [Flavobacterium sp. SaA2.13]